MREEFLNRFKRYLEEWERFDSIRIHWMWKILYPIGFFLEMRILNQKHRLTKEYEHYLDTVKK